MVKTKQILKVVLQADEKCYQRKERESIDKTAFFLMFAKQTATQNKTNNLGAAMHAFRSNASTTTA